MPKGRDIWRRVRFLLWAAGPDESFSQPTPTEWWRAHPLPSGFQMLCLWHPARSPALLLGWLAGADPALSASISQSGLSIAPSSCLVLVDLSEAWHQPLLPGHFSLSPPCPAPAAQRQDPLGPHVCWDSLASLLSPLPWGNQFMLGLLCGASIPFTHWPLGLFLLLQGKDEGSQTLGFLMLAIS